MNGMKARLKVVKLAPVAALLGALVLLVSGCSGSRALEAQVDELSREVTRLKAEKANLAARSAALDDKLVLLERKAGKCDGGDEDRGLKVVRLTSEDSLGYDEAVLDEQVVSFKGEAEAQEKDDGERPVLTLHGFGAPAPARAPRRASSVSSGPVPMTGMGDNLGVVRAESVAATVTAETEAPGSMASFQSAYRAYSNRSYDEALGGFTAFIDANPGHGYVDNAMYWRAECYLAQGKILKAVGEFERLLRKFPKSEKGPSALYRIGFAYDRLNDHAKAREYYFKVVDRHPGTEAARKASRRVAALSEKGGASGLLETSAKR